MAKFNLADKEKLEREILNSARDDILTPSNLQYKKAMADSFEELIDPASQEEAAIKNKRRKFVKKNIAKVGL